MNYAQLQNRLSFYIVITRIIIGFGMVVGQVPDGPPLLNQFQKCVACTESGRHFRSNIQKLDDRCVTYSVGGPQEVVVSTKEKCQVFREPCPTSAPPPPPPTPHPPRILAQSTTPVLPNNATSSAAAPQPPPLTPLGCPPLICQCFCPQPLETVTRNSAVEVEKCQPALTIYQKCMACTSSVGWALKINLKDEEDVECVRGGSFNSGKFALVTRHYCTTFQQASPHAGHPSSSSSDVSRP